MLQSMNLNGENNNNYNALGCGICGKLHNYLECRLVKIKRRIADSPILSRARSTLPYCVRLVLMSDGSYSIVATTNIENGTQFGPLEAQKLLTLDPSIQLPLKVFNSQLENLSEYYFDTCDENHANWMMFVNAAQNFKEQNLMCFQEELKIFYVTTNDIKAGEHLKLWYSPHYAKLMGKEVLEPKIPVSVPSTSRPALDIDELLKAQQNIVERDNWSCKFCGKLENTVNEFATHMIDHYTKMLIEKTCEICKNSFPDRSHLRMHKITEHKMALAKSKKRKQINVQKQVLNKNKEDVGGPLFNDVLNDSFDNSNLAMPNLELNQFSLSLENNDASQSILENDNLSLNGDILLMGNVKEFDHFNFEIGESQEQHVCDICLRSFAKLSLLRLHMKMHTGRNTCRHCFKIFSRSETLKTHVCNNYKPLDFICHFCQRTFMLKKQLRRHINVVHEKKYICKKCGTNFYSPKDLNDHICNALPNSCKKCYNCPTCNKEFVRERTFKRHIKTHSSDNVKKLETSENFICDICGVKYITPKGLRMHICLHKQRNFECEICNKKFFRLDVLKTHMEIHFPLKVSCKICNVECKSQIALTNHMGKHKNLFKCESCPKSYHQQFNLVKHQQSVHTSKCNVCKKVFDSEKLLKLHGMEHGTKLFQCPVCKKHFKLKSSLRRHAKQVHPEEDIEKLVSQLKCKEIVLNKAEPVENFLENNGVGDLEKDGQGDYETNLVDSNDPVNLDNIVTNFDDIINDYDCTDEEYLLIGKKTSDNVEEILDFNDLSMDFDSHLNIPNTTAENNREICLSMPDLTTGDQEITLGENAYVLDNGTIVDRKEPGKYVCYVLN